MAIIWESFGPYHFSRYDAFRSHAAGQGHHVYGVEVSNMNNTYAWSRSAGGGEQVFSLFTAEAAENISAWRVYNRFSAFIKKHSVEVVFVPSYWPAYALAVMIAAKSCNIKVVLMMESHYASGRNQGLAFFLKQRLIGFYDSALVGGYLHRLFVRKLGMSPWKIFDGYDVVDNGHFERASAILRGSPAQYGISLPMPGRFFLSLGRFVEKKNLELIIRAYADLVRAGRHGGHALLFVGSGVKHSALRELAMKLKLNVWDHELPGDFSQQPLSDGNIYFHPFAQLDAVPEYYARATAFILASTNEEWGLVVNEAMASGCPTLVSSAVGCAPDLVRHGETGYIFDPRDVGALADCMTCICNDVEHAKALGRAAQLKIADWSCGRFGRNAVRAAQAALGDREVARMVI